MPSTMEPSRIISMELCPTGTTDSHFRILTNRSVKHITVQADALDIDSLIDMPLDFVNVLPPLLYQENTWKMCYQVSLELSAAYAKLLGEYLTAICGPISRCGAGSSPHPTSPSRPSNMQPPYERVSCAFQERISLSIGTVPCINEQPLVWSPRNYTGNLVVYTRI